VDKILTSNLRAVKRGFTLVELLISLALGILLTSGIVSIYLQNRQSFIQDEEVARLQENARYAMNMLKRDLIMAGFMGGLNDLSVTPLAITSDCATNWATNTTTPIDFINDHTTGNPLTTRGTVTWNAPCLDTNSIVDGTDLISVKRTADSATLKQGVLNTTGEDFDQVYLRAFDHKADVNFRHVSTGDSDITDDTGAKVDYWEYYSRIYFVRNFSKTAGDSIPTLCLAELIDDQMQSNCYVEGIEDFQLEVGIDSNDDSVPDHFETTPTSAELNEAVVVRVYLLVRSVNPIGGYLNSKAYNLGGKAVAAKNDGFIRRVFSTTVQMRNAKLPNA
jgi:prepilin-type N-terminal cleavage/methylation domain-containing protein